MKNLINSVLKVKITGLALIAGVALFTTACNKDFENTLPKSFKNDTAGLGANQKKVLYIILDGVRGNVVQTLMPTNLTAIVNNSTYSYDGLADANTNSITNAAGWANMVTGMDYSKHQVVSEDFSGLNLQAAPTLFTRLKSSLNTDARTVSFAASAAFNDNLAADASLKQTFADDAAVKTATVTELQNADPTLVVAQFHSAETAGATNGYTATTTAYTGAIQTLDGYIGEMLVALKARKNYSGENWLVVISSNKGGATTSGGAAGSNVFNDLSRNTFFALYNPNFLKTPVDQPALDKLPFEGSGIRFEGTYTSNTVAKLTNTAIGNFGTTGSYTVMYKFRNDNVTTAGNYYPGILGKRANLNTAQNNQGWSFYLTANSLAFDLYYYTRSTLSTSVRDGVWHTVALKYSYVGTTRYATTYFDGVKKTPVAINTTYGNGNNTVPLQIGSGLQTTYWNYTNYLIRDLTIYNADITDADIIDNMRRTSVNGLAAYQANVVGYWPCDEGQGTTFYDKSGKGNNFTVTGPANWVNFSDVTANVSPDISQSAFLNSVPNNIDIPIMIYHWLNISNASQWNLMGKLYTPSIALTTN